LFTTAHCLWTHSSLRKFSTVWPTPCLFLHLFPLDVLLLLCCCCSEPEEGCVHQKELVFRVLSRQKSFYLRCETTEDRDSWYQDLTKYIK
jgi:hypothetical protein